MIIQWDNLEALKSLLPKYEWKVKCIYIDPPYNTGNEWRVYNDNVNHPKIKKRLWDVVGKEWEDLSRHDKWLCMMYPRLKLLHRLLRDDGVIFVSINETEIHNLKIICSEIFWKSNFIESLIWKTDWNFDNQAKIKSCHEYILVYSKNISTFEHPELVDPNIWEDSKLMKPEIRNTIVKNWPKNPISKIDLPKWFPSELQNSKIQQQSSKFPYIHNDSEIKNFELSEPIVIESWRWSKTLLEQFIRNNFEPVLDTKWQETRFIITANWWIDVIKKREKNSHVISVLQWLWSTQSTSWMLKTIWTTFDYPKPVNLIEYLLSFQNSNDGIILDSFAWSWTTAHAVLNLNKQDWWKRKFILVEMEDYAESITAERVNRVIDGYGEEKKAVEGAWWSYDYYVLWEPMFLDEDTINEAIWIEKIREYIRYAETKSDSLVLDAWYILWTQHQTEYHFYYHPDGITTLDHAYLATLTPTDWVEQRVIYADLCALDDTFLHKHNIIFKKIPRDISRF